MSLYLGTTSIASDGSHRLPGEIGDIGIAPFGIDESLNLRRYLNGQVISQTQFEAFTNKIKSAITFYPNLSATEENWQAEVTNSKLGQCGKFVIDDEAGTIRLPKVVNINGLQDLALIGGIKAESLPDAIYYSEAAWGSADASKSLVASKGGYEDNNTGKGLLVATKQDSSSLYDYSYGKLSASNSVYQDNAPVQQEAVQYPYYIQVATGVEETLPAIREYKVNNSNFFGQSMWSDIEPNNASLLASNGQYNTRVMYPDYYNWLLGLYNNPTESNVIKVGSILDDNGVLSGFSTSNYVKLPSAFSPNFNSWEFVRKITTGNDVSTVQGLTDGVGLINVASSIDSSKSRLYLSSNGSTWDISAGILGTYTVLANTTYYVKISYNGSAYTLSYSTDGETYTTDITVPSSTPIYSNVTLELGAAHGTTLPASPFLGSIDLNESYININGQRWWNGRKSAVVKTGETSISIDYDYIINTADETFRLPLLNGEENLVDYSNRIALSGTEYTAQVNGWIVVDVSAVNTVNTAKINNEEISWGGGGSTSHNHGYIIPLSKGDKIVSTNAIRAFYPAKGNGTLYYYVGDIVQDASLINAGRVLEYFSKLNTVHCVVETFKSGTSWYRVYDDGWVEQGATILLTACPQTITMLKQYQDNNYTICIGGGDPDSNAAVCSTSVYSRAVGSFSLASGYNGTFYSCVISWFACGYGA